MVINVSCVKFFIMVCNVINIMLFGISVNVIFVSNIGVVV